MAKIKEIISLTFNKYFYALLDDVKTIYEKDKLAEVISRNYMVKNARTTTNVLRFIQNMNKKEGALWNLFVDEGFDILDEKRNDENLLTFHPLKNISVRNIFNQMTPQQQNVVLHYLVYLTLFAYIYDLCQSQEFLVEREEEGCDEEVETRQETKDDEAEAEDEDDEGDKEENISQLYHNIVNIIKSIESNAHYEDWMKNIYDKKVIHMLNKINHIKTMMGEEAPCEPEEPRDPNGGDDDFLRSIQETLKNSKIGHLAQEVIKDVNINEESVKNISNIQDFMQSGQLGNIMHSTVNKFQQKMANGEISQNDLLSDFSSLMGNMGQMMGGKGASGSGMPFDMGELQKMAQLFGNKFDPLVNNPQAQQTMQKSATQERLRKKLASQQKDK